MEFHMERRNIELVMSYTLRDGRAIIERVTNERHICRSADEVHYLIDLTKQLQPDEFVYRTRTIE
jgi:hypothetical protein